MAGKVWTVQEIQAQTRTSEINAHRAPLLDNPPRFISTLLVVLILLQGYSQFSVPVTTVDNNCLVSLKCIDTNGSYREADDCQSK